MKLRLILGMLVSTLSLQLAQAETLEEIVAKNHEARGGLEKIRSIQSAVLSGKMVVQGGAMEAPIKLTWMRPDKIRLEFTVQGMTGVQASDGETSWMVMPFMGKTEPEKMGEMEAESIEEQADFDGPLVDYEEKGISLEYLGTEDVEGTPAHKIKLVRKNGNEETIYLDAEHYVQIKGEGTQKMQDQEFEVSTTIGDYKEIDGLMLPHSFEIQGPQGGQTLLIEKVELNTEIDGSIFAMPATAEDEVQDASEPAEEKKDDESEE